VVDDEEESDEDSVSKRRYSTRSRPLKSILRKQNKRNTKAAEKEVEEKQKLLPPPQAQAEVCVPYEEYEKLSEQNFEQSNMSE